VILSIFYNFTSFILLVNPSFSFQIRRGSVARCYTCTAYHRPAIQPGVPFRVYDIHIYITVFIVTFVIPL
jgi:hypothetical protein